MEGGCPVHCGILSSILGPYPPSGSSTYPVSSSIAKCPLEAKSPLVENHYPIIVSLGCFYSLVMS